MVIKAANYARPKSKNIAAKITKFAASIVTYYKSIMFRFYRLK